LCCGAAATRYSAPDRVAKLLGRLDDAAQHAS
jgi:hypothetical protein